MTDDSPRRASGPHWQPSKKIKPTFSSLINIRVILYQKKPKIIPDSRYEMFLHQMRLHHDPAEVPIFAFCSKRLLKRRLHANADKIIERGKTQTGSALKQWISSRSVVAEDLGRGYNVNIYQRNLA